MDNNSGRSGFLTTLISGVVGIPVFFALIVLLSSIGVWLSFIVGFATIAVIIFVLASRHRTRKFLEEYYNNFDSSKDDDN